MVVGGVIVLWLAAGVLAQPNAAEQIVFSGQNPPSTGVFTLANGATTPFGFWIWCQSEDASNPYKGVCQGSVYFYGLPLIRAVNGGVEESSEGMYEMTVGSPDGAVACVFTTVPPVMSGPTNTVNAACSMPSGHGMATNVVVQATGPSYAFLGRCAGNDVPDYR